MRSAGGPTFTKTSAATLESGVAIAPIIPAANNAETKIFFIDIFVSPEKSSNIAATAWRPDCKQPHTATGALQTAGTFLTMRGKLLFIRTATHASRVILNENKKRRKRILSNVQAHIVMQRQRRLTKLAWTKSVRREPCLIKIEPCRRGRSISSAFDFGWSQERQGTEIYFQ